MPGKRQHYIPRVLLRRFAIEPADKRSLIWKLPKSRGGARRVSITNEAVVGRYYRMVLEDGTVVDEADEILDRIENMAKDVIPKLKDADYWVTGDDVFRLVLFIVTLKNRTPQAREALRETDEQMADLWLEVVLSDRERYHRTMGKTGRAAEDIEADRVRFLGELREGKLGLQSSPEREVALMLAGLPEAMERLLPVIDITCMRVPEGSKRSFVISDHPVSHYDPTPKAREAGAGFLSSPNSVTWVPLDPRFGLLLGQQRPGSWLNVEVSDAEIDELNLQTYAWAREAIYGPSQAAVTRVREVARAKPKLLHELRYRPPRVWVGRTDGGGGTHEFRSRFRGNTAKALLHVRDAGAEHARRNAWPPEEEPE
jgi:hypothetical protein